MGPKPRYADALACTTLAALVDTFEKTFKTPLCQRIEDALNAIDSEGGEYRAIEPTNDEVILVAPNVYVENLNRPEECSCRKRTILVSYADENVRSFFFCLRVQEYDFRGGAVEAGNAAIEYMESVPGIVPKKKRKAIYQGILAAYISDLSSRGFERLYLKAEPPDIGEDYIFPGTSAARGNTDQASEDALPDYDYLLKWYEGAFDHFVSDLGILTSYTNKFEHIESLDDLLQLPLLDGDKVLPAVLEDVFALDRVVRSSERYAELFRARMEEKRTSHPYPDVYYVLMLADANVMRTRRIHAKYGTLPDNMTVTRKGIHAFCKRHSHTFQTPDDATAASDAILLELFLQYAEDHVDKCDACEPLRKQKTDDAEVLTLAYALHGLNVDDENAGGRTKTPEVVKASEGRAHLRERNSDPSVSVVDTERPLTRSQAATVADRVRKNGRKRQTTSESDG